MFIEIHRVLVNEPHPECVHPREKSVHLIPCLSKERQPPHPGQAAQLKAISFQTCGDFRVEGWPGIERGQSGRGKRGGAHVPTADVRHVSSGLGGEEQADGPPAAAVSVHQRQRMLPVVLDHGGHRGEELLMIPALPAQRIVVPAIQLPDGDVEDSALEEYSQGEGLGTVRPGAEAHGVGSVLLEVKEGSIGSLTVTVP